MPGLNLTDAEIQKQFGDGAFTILQQADRLNVGGTYVGEVRNAKGEVTGSEVRNKIDDGPKAEQRRIERLISVGMRIEKGQIALPPGADRRLLAAVCFKRAESASSPYAQVELMRLRRLEERKPEDQQNAAIVSFEYGFNAMIEQVNRLYDKCINRTTTIPERLDAAYEISKCVKLLLSDSDSSAKQRVFEQIGQGKLEEGQRKLEEVGRMLSEMLNTKNATVIVALMEERIRNRGFNPEFIPGSARPAQQTKIADAHEAKSRGQYNLRQLAGKALRLKREQLLAVTQVSRDLDQGIYKGIPDAIEKTKMFDSQQRNPYRIYVSKGKFVRQGGNLGLLCDTERMFSHYKQGYAAYVLNVNGEISIFNHQKMRDQIAHSSMNAGVSVIAAGEIKIKDGKLLELTNHSGHYKPMPKQVCAALKEFQRQGIDISQAKVRLFKEYISQGLVATDSPQDIAKIGLKYTYDASALLAAVERDTNAIKVQEQQVKNKTNADIRAKALAETKAKITAEAATEAKPASTTSTLIKMQVMPMQAPHVMKIITPLPDANIAPDIKTVRSAPPLGAKPAPINVAWPQTLGAKPAPINVAWPQTVKPVAVKRPLPQAVKAIRGVPPPTVNDAAFRGASPPVMKTAPIKPASPPVTSTAAARKSPQPAKKSKWFNKLRTRLANERKQLAGDRVGATDNPLRETNAEKKRTPANDAKAHPASPRLKR